jgi:hypothetical protein
MLSYNWRELVTGIQRRNRTMLICNWWEVGRGIQRLNRIAYLWLTHFLCMLEQST